MMVSINKLRTEGTKTLKVNGASSNPLKPLYHTPKSKEIHKPSPTPVSRNHVPEHDNELLIMLRAEANRPKLINFASKSAHEFQKMVHGDSTLWKLDKVSENYVLNSFEYKKQFEPLDPVLEETIEWIKGDMPVDQLPDFSNIPFFDDTGSKAANSQPLVTECTKESRMVFMNPLDLVRLLMDVNKWSNFFFDNVHYAEVLEKIAEGKKGPTDCDGAVQLVFAEFIFPSPLVQNRKCYFLRSCYEMEDSESWAVVDVSLNNISPNLPANYKKKPSGCLIKADEKAGYSKVTWLEHVEVDNSMVHKLFKPYVPSGYGFGAARWVSTLTRQIVWNSSYMFNCVEVNEQGRKNLLRLAERMTRRFIVAISSPSIERWKRISVPDSEDILIQAVFNTKDPGTPKGVFATVSTIVWLQALPCKVLDFLSESNNRHKWDPFSQNRPTQALVSVMTDTNKKSGVSIIHVPGTMPVIFMLQEVTVRPTGTYIVYSPVDMHALNSVLQGEDSHNVQILASGFVVMPDRPPIDGENMGGTLLTISFQIADDAYATMQDLLPQNSVETFQRIMTETLSLIKAAMI